MAIPPGERKSDKPRSLTNASGEVRPHGDRPALDHVDLAVLESLVRDARLSQRRIAREVGMSAPAVAERIARLERAGIIRGYRADIDRARLGFPVVAYVSVTAVNALKEPEVILAALQDLPEVEEVSVVTGPMDLILRLRVRDHEHLRDCLIQIWKLADVNRTETFLTLVTRDEKCFDLDLIRMLRDRSLAAPDR